MPHENKESPQGESKETVHEETQVDRTVETTEPAAAEGVKAEDTQVEQSAGVDAVDEG
jgi:hypothetical protein